MHQPPSVTASFVDGLAKPPASNSPPVEEAETSQAGGLGPLSQPPQPLHWLSLGLVRAAGPSQLCD
jgi:hypothetical protein